MEGIPGTARHHYVRLDIRHYLVCPLTVDGRIEVAADLDQVLVTCDGVEAMRNARSRACHQTITDPEHAGAVVGHGLVSGLCGGVVWTYLPEPALTPEGGGAYADALYGLWTPPAICQAKTSPPGAAGRKSETPSVTPPGHPTSPADRTPPRALRICSRRRSRT